MKILKRILLALAILIVAFLIIFNQNISAFIYNEFEWQARARFFIAEKILDDVEYMIGIRTGKEDVFLSDEVKWDKLADDIDKGIDTALELTDEYFTFLNRQDKIPLLPTVYKEYQELKKTAFENYQKGLLVFKEIKEKEHKGSRLVRQSQLTYDKFTNPPRDLSDEEYFNHLKEISETAQKIINEAEVLYNDNVIDEGFKDYVVFGCQKMIDVYKLLSDPQKITDSETLAKEIKTIGERSLEIELKDVTEDWHKNILDDLNIQKNDYMKFAFEQMKKADDYYHENDLKNDLISRLLSKFIKDYPRNI